MYLEKLVESISPRLPGDLMHGVNWNTPLADAAGVAPVSRDISFQAEIDRSNPIDRIMVFVKFNQDVVPATLNPDAMGNLIKRIVFQRNGVGAAPGGNHSRGTLTVVDARGIDLISTRYQVANNDKETFSVGMGSAVARTTKEICYVLQLADDQIDDPLRAYTLCPVHLDSTNPTLKLSFASQAELDLNAAATVKMKLLQVRVVIVRRNMPPQVTQMIIDDGGFIESDQISKDTGVLSSGYQKIVIDAPGEYEHLLITGYSGAATAVMRSDISDANNKIWKLRQQGKDKLAFEQESIQALNSETLIHGNNAPFYVANTVFLDFVSDQQSNADNNLGSLLDTNLDNNNGQQTTLELTVSAALTNPRLQIFGRRILSPIGKRRFKFAKNGTGNN